MKSITFNQLQFRIFIIIFALFTSAVLGYRVFIERPLLTQSITEISQRELTTLNYATKKSYASLASITYDYAVWDATYVYAKAPTNAFVNENFVNNTFLSNQIDGVFILDKNDNLLYKKGFDFHKNSSLDFDLVNFIDFANFPKNKVIIPKRKDNEQVAVLSGVIKTQYGPAMFNATDIRDSNQNGDNRGTLIFLRLIDKALIKELAENTFTTINITLVDDPKQWQHLSDWREPLKITNIVKTSQLAIKDIHGIPLAILSVAHSKNQVPELLDKESILFILIFTILIFVVYSIIAQVIVLPVKTFAKEIKVMDNTCSLEELSSASKIDELQTVSKHFNALVKTVKHQEDLLRQQVYIDPLTQIGNRRAFEEHIEKLCQLYIRKNFPFSVIIADVDHFKKYNDALGHVAGDAALIQIAQTLDSFFQRSNDICTRYGGEEFIMAYSDISIEEIDKKLAQIIAAFATLNLAHPNSPTAPYISVSLGACCVLPSKKFSEEALKDLPPKTIIRLADKALYLAKEQGRNKVVRVSHP